jgi:PDZ domain-containing protein
MAAPIPTITATRARLARRRTSRPGRAGTPSVTEVLEGDAPVALRALAIRRRRARWGTGTSVAGLRSPLTASLAATAIEPPTTTSVSNTVDTTSATLPVAPPEPPLSPPGASRRVRWPWLLGAVGLLVAAASLFALVVELPYYTIAPGSARPTEPTVSVEGAETYPAGEDLLFTTVTIGQRRVNGFEWLQAKLDPDIELVPAEQIDGGQSPEENQQLNQQLMDASEDTAVVVALEHLGYDVVSGTGATVADVVPGAPADGVIEPGDTVVRAAGQPVERVEDLVTEIDALAPGDELTMVVEPDDGPRRRVTVELAAFPDAPDEPFLGVSGLSTRDVEYDYPFEVTIDPGQVRGPSAGLAFTLAVLDVLTPGDISNGVPVAVTGTIDGLGRVGPIGGADFKALAAEQAGAELFLVPAGEEDLARSRVGDDLEVVPVATLQDALEALDELGANATDLESPLASAG